MDCVPLTSVGGQLSSSFTLSSSVPVGASLGHGALALWNWLAGGTSARRAHVCSELAVLERCPTASAGERGLAPRGLPPSSASASWARRCRQGQLAHRSGALRFARSLTTLSPPAAPVTEAAVDDAVLAPDKEIGSSFAARARWYTRQAAGSVLTPEDLARLSSPSCGERAPAATSWEVAANMFVGYASLPRASPSHLHSMYAALPLPAQVAVVCRCIPREVGPVAGGVPSPPPLRLPLSARAMIASLLSSASALRSADGVEPTEERSSALLTLVRALRIDLCGQLDRGQVYELLRWALRRCSRGHSANTPPLADADRVVQHVLRLGEAAKLHRGETGDAWCNVLEHEAGGLAFEAGAYRLGAGRPAVGCEPHWRRPGSLGWGRHVGRLLRSMTERPPWEDGQGALARFPEQVDALCAGMPPDLRAYTIDLCALHLVRARQESAASWPASPPGVPPPPLLLPESGFATGMTYPQFCSHTHFVLGCGNRQTATVLLAESHTRQQVVATMRYTHNAGWDVAMMAAKRLLRVRPSDRVWAAVRFGRSKGGRGSPQGRAVLVFELMARGGLLREGRDPAAAAAWKTSRGDPGATAEDGGAEGEEGELLLHAFFAASLPRKHVEPLRRALAATCPGLLSHGSRSVEAALLAVSPAVVPFLCRAPGVRLDPRVVSWWAATLARNGRLDTALAVLRAAHACGVLPNMWVLVLLLEQGAHREETLRGVIEFVETNYAAVADSVLRAFVERAASHSLLRYPSGLTPQSAADFLSTVAFLGLRHFPRCALEMIALEAPTPTVEMTLRLMEQQHTAKGSRAAKGIPAPVPLHVDAVSRLLEALQELGLRPEVDVYTECVPSRDVSWWASSSWTAPSCAAPAHHASRTLRLTATERIYRSSAVALWPLAADELAWHGRDTSRPLSVLSIHKALRIIALGCDDGTRVVRLFSEFRPALMKARDGPGQRTGEPEAGGRGGGGGRRRSAVQHELHFIHTTAFMAEALARRGLWEEALQLFPRVSVQALPPLLKVARLAVMRHEVRYARVGEVSLANEVNATLQEHHAARLRAERQRWRRQPKLRRPRRPGRRLRPHAASCAAGDGTLEELECLLRCHRPLRRLLRHLNTPHHP